MAFAFPLVLLDIERDPIVAEPAELGAKLLDLPVAMRLGVPKLPGHRGRKRPTAGFQVVERLGVLGLVLFPAGPVVVPFEGPPSLETVRKPLGDQPFLAIERELGTFGEHLGVLLDPCQFDGNLVIGPQPSLIDQDVIMHDVVDDAELVRADGHEVFAELMIELEKLGGFSRKSLAIIRIQAEIGRIGRVFRVFLSHDMLAFVEW